MVKISPVTEKERLYLEKWKTVRLKKRNYILKHGILFWSLPVATAIYFINEYPSIDWLKISFSAVMWSLIGLWFGHMLYKGREKRYREVYPESGLPDSHEKI